MRRRELLRWFALAPLLPALLPRLLSPPSPLDTLRARMRELRAECDAALGQREVAEAERFAADAEETLKVYRELEAELRKITEGDGN